MTPAAAIDKTLLMHSFRMLTVRKHGTVHHSSPMTTGQHILHAGQARFLLQHNLQ
jgi:hypothetical protein